MSINPMLAATIESSSALDEILYPVFVSPKLDGVRCLTDENGTPKTRKGEDFLNTEVARLFAQAKVGPFLDGELGVGDPTEKKFFSTTSGATRRDGYVPDGGFVFYVFDRAVPSSDFCTRIDFNLPKDIPGLKFKFVEQYRCINSKEILNWEDKWVKQGYEGIMIRSYPYSKLYKHGRSTMKSQELMKYKRFADTEGELIGFEEGNTNTNEATKDALGHTKRSSAKAGKVPNGRAGVLLVRCPLFKEVVRIGTGIGLTHELRKHMWENQDEYVGRQVTFEYQHGSDYVKARFPSFKGFRDD